MKLIGCTPEEVRLVDALCWARGVREREREQARVELHAALDALRRPLDGAKWSKQLQVEPEVSEVLDAVVELRRMIGRRERHRDSTTEAERANFDVSRAERRLGDALRSAKIHL